MANLVRVERYLRDVVSRKEPNGPMEEQLRDVLEEAKSNAVQQGDREKAKLIWCWGQILGIHNNYLAAFGDMECGNYYSSWCLLERVEIALASLGRHFESKDDEYSLHFINKHVEQFQSLFPYKVFASPGMLVKEKICSICGDPILIRNPCGHEVGEIYDGEMCYRRITEAEILEISFVETPGHKYAVAFAGSSENSAGIKDQYNYAAVRYVVDGLRSPFDTWGVERTKRRHPHSRYDHVTQDADCPCESGKTYGDCCLSESGVLRPHLNIIFSVPPPESQTGLMYVD